MPLGGVTALLEYVDDIIVIENDEKEGELVEILWIEVAHSRQGIFVSQQKYIVDLLRRIGKLVCKPA